MLGEAGLRYRQPGAFWLRMLFCEGFGVNRVLGDGKTAVSAGSWVLKLPCGLELEFERQIDMSFQVNIATRRDRHLKNNLPCSSRAIYCFNISSILEVLTNIPFRWVIYQGEVNVMILRFSTHPESSSLNSGVYYSDEFAEAGWV